MIELFQSYMLNLRLIYFRENDLYTVAVKNAYIYLVIKRHIALKYHDSRFHDLSMFWLGIPPYRAAWGQVLWCLIPSYHHLRNKYAEGWMWISKVSTQLVFDLLYLSWVLGSSYIQAVGQSETIDKISLLPDDLLLNILSSVSINEMVSMSVRMTTFSLKACDQNSIMITSLVSYIELYF